MKAKDLAALLMLHPEMDVSYDDSEYSITKISALSVVRVIKSPIWIRAIGEFSPDQNSTWCSYTANQIEELRIKVDEYSEDKAEVNYAEIISDTTDYGGKTSVDIFGTWEKWLEVCTSDHLQNIETIRRYDSAVASLILCE